MLKHFTEKNLRGLAMDIRIPFHSLSVTPPMRKCDCIIPFSGRQP
jgi:hypothetical protein